MGSATDELSAVTPARGKPWMFCSSARGLQYAHHADAAARPPKSASTQSTALEYGWITRLRRSRR